MKAKGYKANAIEFEGANVEEAIGLAVKKFGFKKDDLDIKIICEEKKGLFGMEGSKPAKIKASLKEKNKKS